MEKVARWVRAETREANSLSNGHRVGSCVANVALKWSASCLMRSTLAEPLGMGALEGTAKADPSVADRDDDDPATQPASESIRLDRDPATGPGVLHNILARLRKRHTESERGLHFETQLSVEDAGGALGDLVYHPVHVLRGTDRRYVEQHVGGTGCPAPGHLPMQLEELLGLRKKPARAQ